MLWRCLSPLRRTPSLPCVCRSVGPGLARVLSPPLAASVPSAALSRPSFRGQLGQGRRGTLLGGWPACSGGFRRRLFRGPRCGRAAGRRRGPGWVFRSLAPSLRGPHPGLCPRPDSLSRCRLPLPRRRLSTRLLGRDSCPSPQPCPGLLQTPHALVNSTLWDSATPPAPATGEDVRVTPSEVGPSLLNGRRPEAGVVPPCPTCSKGRPGTERRGWPSRVDRACRPRAGGRAASWECGLSATQS